MDLQQRIQKARAAGYTDEQINTRLQEKGIAMPSAQQSPKPSQDWGDIPDNFLPSLGRNAAAIGGAFLSPIQTVKNLGKTAMGGVEKLIPGQQGEEVNFDNLINFYKERYGGGENIKQTIIQDPVGALMDASMVAGGAGSLLKGAGTASKVGALGRAGEAVSTIGKYISPLDQAANLVKGPISSIGSLFEKAPGSIASRYINPVAKGARESEVASSILKGTPRLGEEVAAAGKIPVSPTKLLKTAQANLEAIYPEIEKTIKASKDTLLPMQSITDELGKLTSQFENSLEGTGLTKEVSRVIKKLVKKSEKGQISVGDLYEIKKNQDKITGKFYDSGKMMGELTPTVQVKIAASNALRDLLNKSVDGLGELNDKYNLWAKVKDSAIPMSEKGYNMKIRNSDLFFGIGGGTVGGIPGALGGLALRRLLTSPTAGLTVARGAQELLGAGKSIGKTAGKLPIKASALINYLFGRQEN